MTRLIPFSLSLLLFSACAAPPRDTANVAPASPNANAPATARATPPATAQDGLVTATAPDAQLRAGGAGEATVRLRIADGYHVNANPPSDKFYIGTQLTVSAAEGVEPGAPLYPAALNKKFGFADKPLAVYEKEAVIRLPLRATAAASKGRHELPAKVRVQPCNDQECFKPRDIQTTIPVTVN